MRLGMFRFGKARIMLIRSGMVRHGPIWCGSVRFGEVRRTYENDRCGINRRNAPAYA